MRSHALRGIAFFAFAITMAAVSAAQQFKIESADYGFGRQRVDVTQRLRELAQANATFRMGNSTFGIDPSPGNVKTLRIHARGPAGHARLFEYREGSIVNGAQFIGWGGGQWGHPLGQYVILGAVYGTAHSNVDVTQRLRDLARTNTFFRMGNSTFGIDPARGHVKTLRIFARGPRGNQEMFEYREGSIVDGSKFSGWGGGNWGGGQWNGGWFGNQRPPVRPPVVRPPAPPGQAQLFIVTARWGTPANQVDVSDRLRSFIRNGRLSTAVNKVTMGSDPAPGAVKTLWVTYTVGGRAAQQQTTAREGTQLNIP
jgi:hypothetical protein